MIQNSKRNNYLGILIGVLLFFSCNSTKKILPEVVKQPVQEIVKEGEVLVKNISEFNNAVYNLTAGDKIILANGIWKDAELLFTGNGKKGIPIILTVEEKGKVFLEGESNLRIGGSYLHVEGLVFRNGNTPTGSVISFRKDKKLLCNHCRITECVVDDFNPSERFDSDYWVAIYGKHNRFDHNYLVGKRNRGVTLAVRLDTEESRENFHRIDHNYFGYHPTLGSNGGETLRIGTSHYSLSDSKTTVENNYFEKCSGELEIISSKSCKNVFNNNTFYECQGTLTMRHGNETMVKNNYIFGNRKPNTGGIRIINETQTVINNYCEGLTGSRFRSALVIMNGVPNSPINRYFQVKDSKASNNLIIDCDNIQLCAGSDEERSATPVNSEMSDNVIYNTKSNELFTIYDDVSGINFTNNILSPNQNFPHFKNQEIKDGFVKKELNFSNINGLKIPSSMKGVGPDLSIERPSRDNTGVSWYPNKDYEIRFNTGEIITVEPGENTIYNAVKDAKAGDIIQLESTGKYNQTKTINLNQTITIRAIGNLEKKPVITFERSSLFAIENGGSLRLEGLEFSGKESDDYSGNSVIRTSRYSMINNYKLIVKDCEFTDLDVNHSFNVLKVYKNTFADSILLSGCRFDNISGHVLNLDKEIDDTGIYNAENVQVENCSFKDVGGVAIKLYRGGRDESTFGPILKLHHSTFENVGHDKRNKHAAAIQLHGVQFANMDNLSFSNSRKIDLHLVVGDPIIKITNSHFNQSEKMISNDEAYTREKLTFENPLEE